MRKIVDHKQKHWFKRYFTETKMFPGSICAPNFVVENFQTSICGFPNSQDYSFPYQSGSLYPYESVFVKVIAQKLKQDKLVAKVRLVSVPKQILYFKDDHTSFIMA